MMDVVIRIIKMIKYLSNIVTDVVFCPIGSVTFTPIWQFRWIKSYFLASRKWKSFISINFIDQPGRNTISTKFLRNNILMEIQHSINTILSQSINKFNHLLQERLVIPIFFRLYSRPPKSSYKYITPNRTPFIPNYL